MRAFKKYIFRTVLAFGLVCYAAFPTLGQAQDVAAQMQVNIYLPKAMVVVNEWEKEDIPLQLAPKAQVYVVSSGIFNMTLNPVEITGTFKKVVPDADKYVVLKTTVFASSSMNESVVYGFITFTYTENESWIPYPVLSSGKR